MSPNLNARGLGLGETPLGRWGGYRGLFIMSVDHCERRRNAELSIAVHRLVLHRSAPRSTDRCREVQVVAPEGGPWAEPF